MGRISAMFLVCHIIKQIIVYWNWYFYTYMLWSNITINDLICVPIDSSIEII